MDKFIRIIFGGDVSPRDGAEMKGLLKSQALFSPKLFNEIKNADLCVVNLETVLGNLECPLPKIGVHLKTDGKIADVLKKSGIGRVNLANNHIFDYGTDGVLATIDALEQIGISHMGTGETPEKANLLQIHMINDIRVGFLVYAEHEFNYQSETLPGTSVLNPAQNILHIQAAKQKCDRLILFTHCGPEGHDVPSPRMVELFHAFAEAGADAIINCHAHRIMGKETYKNVPIYYGLGNLFFPAQGQPVWWYHGLMVELAFHDGQAPQSREIFTTFANINHVDLETDSSPHAKNFCEISKYCCDNESVLMHWMAFCRSQRKHLAWQCIKGVFALLPYVLISRMYRRVQWHNDQKLAARGARMLRGLCMCENHIDEFRTIFDDLMNHGI